MLNRNQRVKIVGHEYNFPYKSMIGMEGEIVKVDSEGWIGYEVKLDKTPDGFAGEDTFFFNVWEVQAIV